MNYYYTGCEYHHINNVNNETRCEVRKLQDYVQQFNYMDDMGSMYIDSLILTVDGEKAEVKDLRVTIPEEDYANQEYEELHGNSGQWSESSELMTLLAKAEDASEICLEVRSLITFNEKDKYGLNYWTESGNEKEVNAGNIERKILQSGEQYDCLQMFKSDSNGSVYSCLSCFADEESDKDAEEEFLADRSSCKDVSEWYCEDFVIDMEGGDNWNEYPEERDLIMNKYRSLVEKYRLINDINEPYEDQILISDCVTVSEDEVDEFTSDIQGIIDLANSVETGIGMKATFVSSKGYPFAAMRMKLDGDRIKRDYYRL